MNRAINILVSSVCILGANLGIAQQSDQVADQTRTEISTPQWLVVKEQDGIVLRCQENTISGTKYIALQVENQHGNAKEVSWTITDATSEIVKSSGTYAVEAMATLNTTSPTQYDGNMMIAIVDSESIHNFNFSLTVK